MQAQITDPSYGDQLGGKISAPANIPISFQREVVSRSRTDRVACYGDTDEHTNSWAEGVQRRDVQTESYRPRGLFFNTRGPMSSAQIFVSYPGKCPLQAPESSVRRSIGNRNPRYSIPSEFVYSPNSESCSSRPDLRSNYDLSSSDVYRPNSSLNSPISENRKAFLRDVPFVSPDSENVFSRGRGLSGRITRLPWYGHPWSDFEGDNYAYGPPTFTSYPPAQFMYRQNCPDQYPFVHLQDSYGTQETAVSKELGQDDGDNAYDSDKRLDTENSTVSPRPSSAQGPSLAEDISTSLIVTTLGHSSFFEDPQVESTVNQVKKELEQMVLDELEAAKRRETVATLSTYPTEEEWLLWGIPKPQFILVPRDFWHRSQW